MVANKLTFLAIVGATASGKTGLAIAIAKEYNGEVIAVDSRTVYKYLDIGTAKPTIKEQQGIPHYGLNIIGPGDTYSAAQFQQYAKRIIKDITARGKLPILVGGSGLYMDSILYDYSFAKPDYEYRQSLEALSNNVLQNLVREKGLVMPENYQNKRYLVQTLARGQAVISKKSLLLGACVIGLDPTSEQLKERITLRAEEMIINGVINEIKHAYELYPEDSEALRGGIYKSFWPFLHGTMTQEDATKLFVISDMQLAKKQRTWFRRNKDITWFANPNDAKAWFKHEYGGTL